MKDQVAIEPTPANCIVPSNKKLIRTYTQEEENLSFLVANLRKQLGEEQIRVRHDDEYLSRFLRVKKYNVQKARTTIVHYQQVLEQNQDILQPIRPIECKSIYDEEIFTILRGIGPKGSTVAIVKAGLWDVSKYSLYQLVQAVHFLFEQAMEDKQIQLNGVTLILDLQGLSMKHLRQISAKELKKAFFLLRSHLPIRVIAGHVINYPRIIWPLYFVVFKMLSKKLQQRVALHPNFASLHERIDSAILPTCLGGPHELDSVRDDSFVQKLLETNRHSSEYQLIHQT